MPNGKKYYQKMFMPLCVKPTPKDLLQENIGIQMKKELTIVLRAATNFLDLLQSSQAAVDGQVFLSRITKKALFLKKIIQLEWRELKHFAVVVAVI